LPDIKTGFHSSKNRPVYFLAGRFFSFGKYLRSIEKFKRQKQNFRESFPTKRANPGKKPIFTALS
jgi:hypothetical protein